MAAGRFGHSRSTGRAVTHHLQQPFPYRPAGGRQIDGSEAHFVALDHPGFVDVPPDRLSNGNPRFRVCVDLMTIRSPGRTDLTSSR